MQIINYEYQLISLNNTFAFDEIINCMFILLQSCFNGKCQNIMHWNSPIFNLTVKQLSTWFYEHEDFLEYEHGLSTNTHFKI